MSAATRPALPPGPRWPRPFATLGWIARPNGMLERCRENYGEIFTLKIAYAGDWVFLGDPNGVRDLFTADPASVPAGEANDVLRPVLGAHSVLLLDGADHLDHRRLLLPPFHGHHLEGFGALMATVTREEVAKWPLERPLALLPRMRDITLEIILRAVLGVQDEARRESLRRAIVEMLSCLMRRKPMLMLGTLGPGRVEALGLLDRVLDPVDRLLRAEIRRRRKDPWLDQRHDILSMLVQARHRDGEPMQEDELRDELVTLLMAGHETTATSLAWAFERLVHAPDALSRLAEEVQSDDHAYADAVVKETLRLRPPVPVVVRRLTQPLEVAGHLLPAGVLVAPSAHLVHRRPELYPEPHRFVPERFLNHRPGTYGWIPFGGGTRRCLGAGFAALEMRVVITEVLRRVALAPDGGPEAPLRRAVTLVPAGGAKVVARRRHARHAAPEQPEMIGMGFFPDEMRLTP